MLALLLTSMLAFAISIEPLEAMSLPVIRPSPLESTVYVGDSFTVDIQIIKITNLAGVGMYVWYNTTILDAVECKAHPDAANLAPIDPITFEWIPINDTLGRILFGYTFWPPKTGNLTLITINFTAAGEGTCVLDINGTGLIDAAGIIEHDVIDGWIVVKHLGDVDGDGEVSSTHMDLVRTHFGQSNAQFPEGDIDNDGKVFASDMVITQINFGAGS